MAVVGDVVVVERASERARARDGARRAAAHRADALAAVLREALAVGRLEVERVVVRAVELVGQVAPDLSRQTGGDTAPSKSTHHRANGGTIDRAARREKS